jgi:hypothetical protein
MKWIVPTIQKIRLNGKRLKLLNGKIIEQSKKRSNMKKFILFTIVTLAYNLLIGQAVLTNAYNANKAGDFETAKKYIDEASSDAKLTEKEKYWRYRGNIYLNLYADSSLALKYPSSLIVAFESFEKCLSINSDYKNEVMSAMEMMYAISATNLDKTYKNQDFCTSEQHCQNAIRSIDFFYKHLSQKELTKMNLDKSSFEKNLEIISNQCVKKQVDLLSSSGKYNEALEIVNQAKKKSPKDATLKTFEADIYLSQKQYVKAASTLEDLVASDSTNGVYWYFLGSLYEKIDGKNNELITNLKKINKGDVEHKVDSLLFSAKEIAPISISKANNGMVVWSWNFEDNSFEIQMKDGKVISNTSKNLEWPVYSDRTENAYLKAVKLAKDYYDANYNLGAFYYNRASLNAKKCDAIRDETKYNDCKAANKPVFAQSAQYFIICYDQDVKNNQDVRSIKKIVKECLVKSGNLTEAQKYN